MPFGSLSSVLPEKAITFPRMSNIGKITLFTKKSKYMPFFCDASDAAVSSCSVYPSAVMWFKSAVQWFDATPMPNFLIVLAASLRLFIRYSSPALPSFVFKLE